MEVLTSIRIIRCGNRHREAQVTEFQGIIGGASPFQWWVIRPGSRSSASYADQSTHCSAFVAFKIAMA